ncbi:lysozyme [Caballeronia sp. dw_19]|uniref:lysozyme n=1 Tax=Caballeronia sp. dw_19 TaxID=2719791 RepID=UPI001BCD49CD|nr:lysozyme [Caballeronia sp. dw_19]
MSWLNAILGMFQRTAPSVPGTPSANVPSTSAGKPSVPDIPAVVPAGSDWQVVDGPSWLDLVRPLVQFFESCRLVAYWDATGKVWTCGWGSTGADVVEGTVWTQTYADARLDAGLNTAGAKVDAAVRVKLSPQQKAALVSILYNVGAGRAAKGSDPGRDGIVVLANGQPSTLLRNLNDLIFATAADQFLVWNKSGGQILNGLVKRRTAERSLFLTGTWK